ncbi:hypothetical protein MRX96_047651 [Rhipicephalus microplus]
MLGLGPRFCGMTSVGGARRSWMSPYGAWAPYEVPGSGPWHGVSAGPAGPPVSVPESSGSAPMRFVSESGCGPGQECTRFSKKVPCAGPAGNMPGCAAAGFPMSSGLPVLSPIAAPCSTVVAGCSAGTGAGRGVALCWAARGDWDRVVAAAEGVVMFALPLDSLGRICGCLGWMSRGAPEVRGLGLAETTCATPGLDAGACCGATGRGATVAVALVVAGVDADDEGRLWLREGTTLGPVVDHETETGAGSGDAECGRLLAG